MKIAVYTIAKDEAAQVERFMASAADADYVLVADTGSADGTVDLLRARGAQVHQIEVRPWRFDVARNRALELLPAEIDICIALDLDEILQPGWRQALESAWVPGATRARYRYIWSHRPDGSPALSFWRDKIHARHGYRWEHPVHELLVPGGDERWVATDLCIEHYPDAARSRGSYLSLLELAVAERPASAPHAFWLGREYSFHGRWGAAIAELARYLGLPEAVWPVERAAAMRLIARGCLTLGKRTEASEWLEQACAQAPQEREPWVDLAQLCHDLGSWEQGYAAACQALALSERPDHYLVEDAAWGARADDLAAICAWHLGRHEAARAHAAAAARRAPSDEWIIANLRLMESAAPAVPTVRNSAAVAPGEPRISLALIVRDEERTLARCLESIAGRIDEIVIVDTGSTDSTITVARRYTDRVFSFAWCDNFAAARQFAFDQATGDWVLWLDADDVVEGAEQIRAMVSGAPASLGGFSWRYLYSRDQWGNPLCELWRERCVRNDGGFRWQGRIHEVLVDQQQRAITPCSAVVVAHHAEAARGPAKVRRNLAILEQEYAACDDAPSARLLFYLGQEYTNAGRLDKALAALLRYLDIASWDDERYLAQLRVAGLYRALGRYEQALNADLQALKIFPRRPEAYFGLAHSSYLRQDWLRVLQWVDTGRSMPPPETACIASPMDYRYSWIIYYTNALYHTGATREALAWTRRALEICPGDEQHRYNERFFLDSLYCMWRGDEAAAPHPTVKQLLAWPNHV